MLAGALGLGQLPLQLRRAACRLNCALCHDAIMGLFVDRIRRAPKCFGMQFLAAIWTQDRTHNVVLQVNYLGLHIYTPGEAQTLMCSFQFLDSLVSWLALNDMLTVHVVHKPTKRSAKLHFLTREAMQIKTMLTRYSEAVSRRTEALHPEALKPFTLKP